MPKNRFLEKLESKSDKELEHIANNSKTFVFDARYAAILILKKRGFNSLTIENIEKEYDNRIQEETSKKENNIETKKQIINHLKNIPIKGNQKSLLKNGNILQIKRLSKQNFEVRIEDNFRSVLAPVIICKIITSSNYLLYPFFYIKSILIYGIGVTILFLILSLVGIIKDDVFLILSPLIFIISFQIILTPFIYFITVYFFKNHIKQS
ncbi:hypothetical protein [Flavobacterium sp.]|uniref:hypothetical protein n=1 Tax=Flavobacterium sp. TaxID=239 RepID=UPI0040475170